MNLPDAPPDGYLKHSSPWHRVYRLKSSHRLRWRTCEYRPAREAAGFQ